MAYIKGLNLSNCQFEAEDIEFIECNITQSAPFVKQNLKGCRFRKSNILNNDIPNYYSQQKELDKMSKAELAKLDFSTINIGDDVNDGVMSREKRPDGTIVVKQYNRKTHEVINEFVEEVEETDGLVR